MWIYIFFLLDQKYGENEKRENEQLDFMSIGKSWYKEYEKSARVYRKAVCTYENIEEKGETLLYKTEGSKSFALEYIFLCVSTLSSAGRLHDFPGVCIR